MKRGWYICISISQPLMETRIFFFMKWLEQIEPMNAKTNKPIAICASTKLPWACSIQHALNNATTPSDSQPHFLKKMEKKEKPLHVSEASNERRDRKGLG